MSIIKKMLFEAHGLDSFIVRAFAFGTISGLLLLVPTWFMFEVYERVLNSRNISTLSWLTLLVVLTIALTGLIDWVRNETLRIFGESVETTLSAKIFQASHFEGLQLQNSTSEVKSLGNLRTIRDFCVSPALAALLDAPLAIVFLGIILLINPILGWVAVLGACLQGCLAWANHRMTSDYLRAANDSSNKARSVIEEAQRSSDIVLSMGILPGFYHRWLELHKKAIELQSSASLRAGFFQALGKFSQTVMASALLGIGALLLLREELTGGPAMLIVASVLGGRTLAPLLTVISQWRLVEDTRRAVGELDQLLKGFPQASAPMLLPPPIGKIVVEKLSAGCARDGGAIIKDIDFALEPGEALAIIGPSASGKSTLARALIGLEHLKSGSVRIDGADIKSWTKSELGPYIGYLPQNVQLLEGDFLDNISRFAGANDTAIKEAAERIAIHQWIQTLPRGYATQIGSGGVLLSGGQGQRVALARAIYMSPVYVVLDEPDSNLDDEGRLALRRMIIDMKLRGTTFIIVTHLPEILEVADKILLLQNGRQQKIGGNSSHEGLRVSPPLETVSI
ncbi:MAG: type I secretion system permease/ATPase [Cytophagaceae bacterium]|nr:MAG: type I secretion system permease/ATPase [Cytophagaceae bacterium]